MKKGYFALKHIAISDSDDQSPRCTRLINHETTKLIRSGDEIRLEIEDPDNCPFAKLESLGDMWSHAISLYMLSPFLVEETRSDIVIID